MRSEVPEDYILDEDSDDEVIVTRSRVVSYGADYTLSSISMLVKEGDIVVQPGFQRNFVWDKNKASKLIESFLLGYPVPNILLGQAENGDTMEVIDGQQRVRVICDFLEGVFNQDTVFKLSGDIDPQYLGKTFKDLDDVDKRKLKNQVLKATILIYPRDNPDLKFSAFQRINTGSVVLNQQEIRNCIYYGSLNDFLTELNKNELWRKFVSPKPDKRMKDEETLLRYFAGLFNGDSYEKSMTKFLNTFMLTHQNETQEVLNDWRDRFVATLKVVEDFIVKPTDKSASPFSLTKGSKLLNRAVFESLMVTISKLIGEGVEDFSKLAQKHQELLADEEYVSYCTSHTSDEKRYSGRMRRAAEILG